jgi:response regulator RpfG family c-di-GMP phosphodiesterase
MREEGMISASQLGSAMQCMRSHNERMEEALLRIRAVDEPTLLRFVAERCRTRYLSSGKLANLDVPDEALRKLPLRIAEKLLAFPVRFERQTDTLSIVSPDAGDPEYVKQAGIATGVKHLKAYVARPAAVTAAIDKWYRGQIQSFALIAPDTFTQLHDVSITEKREPERAPEWFMTPAPAQGAIEPPRAEQPEPAPASEPLAPPAELVAVDRRLTDLTELLHVLVALGENGRDDFRGHSASVGRLSRLLVQRMGQHELAATQAAVAANLHDLGKPVAYHLTALNVCQYATHRRAAEKLVHTPARLVESVGLPPEAVAATGAMYERFDGRGFPSGLAGKRIPLGARILALCDTYSDLTQNPANPHRKELSHEEAQAVLGQFRATIFDPDLVDLLSQLVAGEDLRRRLTDDSSLVLVVEPDPEEATILELRLVAQGFEVRIAKNAEQALRLAQAGGIGYVLSEVELEPFDGFELLRRLRADASTRELGLLFVARASDSATIDRAFSLGAQDYVVKPTSGDVLAGKLRRLAAASPASRRPDVSSGVAGSLGDMALPDLVQILGHGRKSGRLKLSSEGRDGEIHFRDGRVVHALLGATSGNDAFFELLAFSAGSFALDPAFCPVEESITGNSDMLILEGLRRLDERNR